MYRSVLVPLDGSVFGEQALPLALGVARRAGASLRLVHAHVPLALVFVEDRPNIESTLEPQVKEHARAYLDGVVKRLTAVTQVPVTASFLEGSMPDVLLDHAREPGTDLVVMTTHGRGPLSRFWLGSVADALVRRITVPLLLIRPQDAAPDLTREPALRHFIVPLDGSALAEQVLEPALALGRLMQADYTLLQVIPPGLFPGYDSTWYGGVDPTQLAQFQVQAQDYLDRVAERLRAQGLSVQARVVLHPQPAAAILDEAQRSGADLVALATHGRGGLGRLLLGSVADKLLRGATTPVLVYHPAAP